MMMVVVTSSPGPPKQANREQHYDCLWGLKQMREEATSRGKEGQR